MKLFIPAASALLLSASPALASVQIRIFESGADVVAEAIGSLSLPPTTMTTHCGGAPGVIPVGAIAPALGAVCVGSGQGFSYSITGPTSFGAGFGRYADESTGPVFGVNGALGLLATAGPTVNSVSIWRNAGLADLGLQPGTLGTWQVGSESITATATPGPFGILAAVLGWSWARRLRRRIKGGR
jgi:hypothetical protein